MMRQAFRCDQELLPADYRYKEEAARRRVPLLLPIVVDEGKTGRRLWWGAAARWWQARKHAMADGRWADHDHSSHRRANNNTPTTPPEGPV